MQGVLPVGRFPTRDYEEITVTLGKVGRLSLLIIVCLENQGNDSRNDHAELKQFFPCNHNRHPLSHWMGAKKSITPEENRGEPPTGVLLTAPSTAYHKNWQIARKTRETLNKSPAAEQRIFSSIRAASKPGNTQSIPPLLKPSAREKSLTVGSRRFNQSFPNRI